jgi:hypothetical protein
MTNRLTLRKTFASLAASDDARRRARSRKLRRSNVRFDIEQFEDRTLLSTFPYTFTPSNTITQFTNQSNTTFLGASFNNSASFGSIDHTLVGDFGAQVNLSMAGEAGLNFVFSGTGGAVNPTYAATLAQSFTEPSGYGQTVTFNPQNTNVSFSSGNLSTTTPSFGYGADLVTNFNGSVGGQFAVFSDFGGSTSFSAGEDLPLFAVNENNNGAVDLLGNEILGASTNSSLPGVVQKLGGAIENAIASSSLEFGISTDPPLQLAMVLNTPQALTFNQDVQLQLGVPKAIGPYKVPAKAQGFTAANLAVDLGSVTEDAPTIALNSSVLGAGGVLSASGSSPIAVFNLQAGALAGSLIGLGALGATDIINLGPVAARITPISFLLQPTLNAVQNVSIQPVSQLTYNFTDSGGNTATPDVTLNGTDLGPKSSVTFSPGKDTVGILFNGNPITVTPSWHFQEILTNEVDLDATLNSTLTVGAISASIPGLGTFSAGPLYQQQFTFANTKLSTLFDQTSTILDQTVTDPSLKFTIGAGFKSSTVVNTNGDNSAPDQNKVDSNGVPINNSLRDAILKANSESTPATPAPVVIGLGAHEYDLTLPPDGVEDGVDGDLLVTASNLTIRGAGAGQTIIKAYFPAGQFDRVFHVAQGASLTLNGVTIEDGNPQDSSVDVGKGGGILEDDNSTLDVENSVITNNQAITGGGIYLKNTTTYDLNSIVGNPLTINNSTISNNTATGQPGQSGQVGGAGLGGGVYLELVGVGSQAIIENSTFSGNRAIGGMGGDGSQSFVSSGGAGGNGGTGEGGGLYVKQTIFIDVYGVDNGNNCLIGNDTFASNTATGGAGGAGGTGFISNGANGSGGDGFGGASRFFEVPDPSGQKIYPDALVNDTIAANTASGGVGGGSFLAGFGASGIGIGGGAYTEPTFGVQAQNTILAHNSAQIGPEMEGTIDSGGTNLIFRPTGITITRAPGIPADLTSVDPKLAPLASNGGPTQTMAIAPGSPAIGAGTAVSNTEVIAPPFPATDQRGYPRTSSGGSVDIGAYEYGYDLAVTGAESFTSSTSNTVIYTFTVTNNGPDAANGVTLTDPFPAHTISAIGVPPTGWSSPPSTTMAQFIDSNPLAPGQSAPFYVILGLILSGSPVSNTATLTPTASANNSANNQIALMVSSPIEGQTFANAVLYHFASSDPTDTAASFLASVRWGDQSANNNSADGTGAVSVVADANGGFDVIGSHVYNDEGHDVISVSVSPIHPGSTSATYASTTLVSVGDASLTSGDVSPPPVFPQNQLNQAVLYHFIDPNRALTPSDFKATVAWGVGTTNRTGDGSGSVSVVADAAGGFDVIGTYSYAANVVGAMRSVQVSDSDGRVFYNPILFHFADANPLATTADFTAIVNWGDGASNTSVDSSGSVVVLADPAGGFDVLGSHAYTQSTSNNTFDIQVTDDGGAVANASASFSVDFPLTAGMLTPPNVTTEGQGVSNALLFHFSDGDSQAQTGEFTATVVWGDGTSSASNDGSGTVAIAADAQGGFDVFGSHTFGETFSAEAFGVIVQDSAGARTGASATSFAIADPSVAAIGGVNVSANENADTGALTLATFTDPGGAEAISEYAASIHWGDGTPDSTGAITYDASTRVFSVSADHVYASVGSDTIAVTITHGTSAAVTVTDAATVSELAVNVSGSFQVNATYGQSTVNRMIATFTDPGGASALADYQPTIDWGDGTTTGGSIGFDTAAPFTYASNLSTGNGPSDALVADLDGTGILDLVVANAADHSVDVFIGNGDGTFQKPVAYSLGAASPTALAVADLTGNGKLDIISANSNTSTVSVLGNNGNGTFTVSQTLSAGDNPIAVAIADLGNSEMDIVTANRGSNNISVFLGTGTGAFGAKTNFAAGTSPDGVACGDVNGDHKPDLVVADAGSDSVSILLGTGTGAFQAARSIALPPLTYQVGTQTISVAPQPAAVALGQLSSSGHLDIVTANAGTDNVSVLLGNGNGTFQTAVNYAVGTTPVAVLIADAYGSGTEDIVTANSGSNNVSVLAGAGNGMFATSTNYALGAGATAPSSIAAGDLNGAGVLDLVTANAKSNNLTLLLPPYAVMGNHTYGVSSSTNPYSVQLTVDHGATSANATVGSVSVARAQLLITADNKTMTYGNHLPFVPGTFTGLTATIMGLVNGDTPSSISGLTLSTVPLGSHVGTYAITVSGATDSNYSITLVNGMLRITPAPLTITANSQTRSYGSANAPLTASYSGFVNGDTASNLTGTLSLSTTATQSSPVGNYPITASGQSSTDYTITYAPGTLAVNRAVLTVTACNASRLYGTANPSFMASYSGFKNGETLVTSGVTGNPSLTTTALASSLVGTYPINAAPGTLAANNYSFAFAPGVLTITPAPLAATGHTLAATAGAPFSGIVASFINADPFGTASSYVSTIQWGDGTSSAGVVTANSSGGFDVSGAHTFAGAAKHAVVVTINHVFGSTASATAASTAAVSSLGLGVQQGQTAGTIFWQGTTGQTLIKSFNGAQNTTALGNWLAATLPNVVGAQAGGDNLAGKTNSQVAAFYLTQFGRTNPNPIAQVLATAFNVYATTLSLGGTVAETYGFSVDPFGLGARSYNVGANGAAFGVANGTVLNVYGLLHAANAQAIYGVLYARNSALVMQALTVFTAINGPGSV